MCKIIGGKYIIQYFYKLQDDPFHFRKTKSCMSRTYLCIQLMITKTKTTKGQIGILVRDKACSLTELTEFSTSPKHNARNSFIKLNFSCVFSKEVNIRSSYCFSLTVHLQEGINKKKHSTSLSTPTWFQQKLEM